MPRYKKILENQVMFIALSPKSQFEAQSFEFAIHYLIEHEIDTTIFDHRYHNDAFGASAYPPKVLLKLILFAYSRGITSSRIIARECKGNMSFMTLSGNLQPGKSHIADFIKQLPTEIESVFTQVLLVCYQMSLVGNRMFAIDGCKMPSNASKEWSGTRTDFTKKKAKLEKAIRYMIQKHQSEDTKHTAPSRYDAEQQQIDKLIHANQKIKAFLQTHRDKPGKRKAPVKSNITDNESAKMKCAKGVIQGVNAITIADAKHQVILGGEVFDSVNERPTLIPVIEQVKARLKRLFPNADVFKMIKLLADSGFCEESNLRDLSNAKIDAYIADALFRKRDPRFKDALSKHSPRFNRTLRFNLHDFHFDSHTNTCICPMGKHMWLKSLNAMAQGYPTIRFQAHVRDCQSCEKRKLCLKKEDQTTPRQAAFRKGESNHLPYTAQMKQKIDSDAGRAIYAKRLGIIEPVFANITATLKLNRLSFRGKQKNQMQWMLFCTVHNISKIMRYGNIPGY